MGPKGTSNHLVRQGYAIMYEEKKKKTFRRSLIFASLSSLYEVSLGRTYYQ